MNSTQQGDGGEHPALCFLVDPCALFLSISRGSYATVIAGHAYRRKLPPVRNCYLFVLQKTPSTD